MPDPSYRKIALISNAKKEVTIPTENLEHDAENDLNSFAAPNNQGGINNKRSIFNMNMISSQSSPTITFTNESVRQLNEPNAIAGQYPDNERSWLPKEDGSGNTSVEWMYAKESARAAIEDMRESGDLVEIEIFDVRALTEENMTVSGLRGSISDGTKFGEDVSDKSTARWPNVKHPTYRRYKGYIKSTKFRERGSETATRYDLSLVFEIGVEQG